MLRDFPACAGLCQDLNIGFCFTDENENKFVGGGDRQRNNALLFFKII